MEDFSYRLERVEALTEESIEYASTLHRELLALINACKTDEMPEHWKANSVIAEGAICHLEAIENNLSIILKLVGQGSE